MLIKREMDAHKMKKKYMIIFSFMLLLSACNNKDKPNYLENVTTIQNNYYDFTNSSTNEQITSLETNFTDEFYHGYSFDFDPDEYYTTSELIEGLTDEDIKKLTTLNLIIDNSFNESFIELSDNITELNLVVNDDVDIAILEYAKKLEKLHVYGSRGFSHKISGIEVLPFIPTLSSLYFESIGNDINLEQLSGCSYLSELVIHDCHSVLVCESKYLDTIETLVIMETPCNDMDNIGSFTKLRTLIIYNCRINDISFINNLSNLERLVLSGITGTELCQLKNIEKLTYLDISAADGEEEHWITNEAKKEWLIDWICKLSLLNELHISEKSFSDDEIIIIKNALPKCEIVIE